MILRLDRVVQTAQGQAISGAQVFFLNQPANIETLTPLANVYADLDGTPAANPAITDGLGQVAAYLDNAQLYTVVVASPLLEQQVYADQNLGNSPSSLDLIGVVPAGAVNGTNTAFTLPVAPLTLLLLLNGLLQIPGLSYTLNSAAITMATPPQAGDQLYAYYTGAPVQGVIPSGVINGTNTAFTLPFAPALAILILNGQILLPGTGFTLTGTALTLTTAPQTGASLYAYLFT